MCSQKLSESSLTHHTVSEILNSKQKTDMFRRNNSDHDSMESFLRYKRVHGVKDLLKGKFLSQQWQQHIDITNIRQCKWLLLCVSLQQISVWSQSTECAGCHPTTSRRDATTVLPQGCEADSCGLGELVTATALWKCNLRAAENIVYSWWLDYLQEVEGCDCCFHSNCYAIIKYQLVEVMLTQSDNSYLFSGDSTPSPNAGFCGLHKSTPQTV